MSEKNQRIAVVPGSFDPITIGHLYIIRQASELYDKIYVAVMINESKDYMFTLDERRRITEVAVRDIPNAEVIASDGMLWELANSLDACAIVKGIRNAIDTAYEKNMAEFNESHYPKGKTVLIPTNNELRDVSSTFVRKLIESSSPTEKYLSPEVAEEINRIFSERKH